MYKQKQGFILYKRKDFFQQHQSAYCNNTILILFHIFNWTLNLETCLAGYSNVGPTYLYGQVEAQYLYLIGLCTMTPVKLVLFDNARF